MRGERLPEGGVVTVMVLFRFKDESLKRLFTLEQEDGLLAEDLDERVVQLHFL